MLGDGAYKAFKVLVIFVAALIAGCGGGGGSGGGSSGGTTPAVQTAPVTFSGYVVKGPIRGGTVRLYSVATDGSKTLLSSVLSGSDGAFQFTTTPAVGTIVLAEVGDGTYTDEISLQSVSLNIPLRAVAIWNGSAMPLSISVYSELAVRVLARSNPQNWSAASVNAANTRINDNFDLTNLLDFKPADLRVAQDFSALREDDFSLSLLSGAFAGFMSRANNIAGTTGLAGALDAYTYLMTRDGFDDRYYPVYVLGLMDFVTVSAFPTLNKNSILNSILTGGTSTFSGPPPSNYFPSGQASGAVIAPMTNNAYEFVPAVGESRLSPVGTFFNLRGALVAYQLNSGSDTYRVLYTSSVGELWGDGDVGIGRWHGGVVADTTFNGISFGALTNPAPLTGNGWAYALAKSATSLPTCGTRNYSYVASTLSGGAAGTIPNTTQVTLTTDSKFVVQFNGSAVYLGAEFGMRMADNSVMRYQTTGGIGFPLAGALFDSNGLATFSAVPAVFTGASVQNVRAMLSGIGGQKLVLKMQDGFVRTLSAVFKDSGSVDTNSCISHTFSSGLNINPAAQSGNFHVTAFELSGHPIGLTVPGYSTFGSRGQLESQSLSQSDYLNGVSSWAIPSSTPTYDLAGYADAFIGLVNINRGGSIQPTPYGVAKPPSFIPASGNKQYTLENATTVVLRVPNVGGTGSTDYYGTVTTAILDVNYGENPIGTPNPNFGTVHLQVNGVINGVPFVLQGIPGQSTPVNNSYLGTLSRLAGGRLIFSGSPAVQAALGGTNAEYAVITFTTVILGQNAVGSILLKAQ